MKLHLDQTGSTNIITGYGADHLMINKVRHDGNLIVTDTEIHTGWATDGFEQLGTEDIARLCELGREIVLIGTGKQQRFPAPHLLRPLMEARIGFEIMDLAAACRTYNVLVGEGRAVAAALLFDPR
ncbi:MAG: Mth938-like domain-containing protein [Parazoarcus communis]